MTIYTGDNAPYGLASGIVFSCRVTVDKSGNIHVVEGLEISPFVQQKLKATEKELHEEKAAPWQVLNLE
jgi:malate/lactate dehydrogenase